MVIDNRRRLSGKEPGADRRQARTDAVPVKRAEVSEKMAKSVMCTSILSRITL
jgi:hypothetical protein